MITSTERRQDGLNETSCVWGHTRTEHVCVCVCVLILLQPAARLSSRPTWHYLEFAWFPLNLSVRHTLCVSRGGSDVKTGHTPLRTRLCGGGRG